MGLWFWIAEEFSHLRLLCVLVTELLKSTKNKLYMLSASRCWIISKWFKWSCWVLCLRKFYCIRVHIRIMTKYETFIYRIAYSWYKDLGLGLCCLMTPGLSKDIRCHVRMTILFLNLQITRSDIRPHIKWAVSLMIAYGHFNLPQGFVWVCGLTCSLYHPQGYS